MTTPAEKSSVHPHFAWRAHGLLFCGAAAGIVLAATGVLRGPPIDASRFPKAPTDSNSQEPLPADAIARINDRLIRREDYQQVLALEVAGGMETNSAARQRILDRMIDEELRVQRAIQLNLHLTDARVRMDLASAVEDSATARVEQETLDEAVLRAYFEKRRDYFARRGPLRIRGIWIAIVAGNLGEAYNRARAATKMLRQNQAFEVVREVVGSAEPRAIPDKLVHPDELALYVGRAALNVALTLAPGAVSDPVRVTDGFHVLQVLERQTHEFPSFEACRLDVEAEYWSERARNALDANASELRKTATIQQAEAF